MPSRRPSARSARLRRSNNESTSIGGSGGSGGGTNARTLSLVAVVSTKRPTRRLDSESDIAKYEICPLFKQGRLRLNKKQA
jgi:hypothetical protein